MKGMKVNKSFLKRMKVSKNGKVMTRKAGKDHNNAKSSRVNQLKGKKPLDLTHLYRRKELSFVLPLPKQSKNK